MALHGPLLLWAVYLAWAWAWCRSSVTPWGAVDSTSWFEICRVFFSKTNMFQWPRWFFDVCCWLVVAICFNCLFFRAWGDVICGRTIHHCMLPSIPSWQDSTGMMMSDVQWAVTWDTVDAGSFIPIPHPMFVLWFDVLDPRDGPLSWIHPQEMRDGSARDLDGIWNQQCDLHVFEFLNMRECL